MAKTEPTVITLTVLPGGGSQRQGTMLIQRGELAQVSQFTFGKMSDITTAIHDAVNALAELELDPPKLSEAKKTASSKSKADTKRKSTKASTQEEDSLDDGAPEEEEDETGAEAEQPEEAEDKNDSDQLPLML